MLLIGSTNDNRSSGQPIDDAAGFEFSLWLYNLTIPGQVQESGALATSIYLLIRCGGAVAAEDGSWS